MQFDNQLSRLWFGTDDAPAPAESVSAADPVHLRIAVEPAAPLNQVHVRYRTNGGVQRLLTAALDRDQSSSKKQIFKVQFPFMAPGTVVEYAPFLTRAGQVLDSLVDGSYPTRFRVNETDTPVQQPPQEAVDPAQGRFPFRLRLIFSITCKLRPEVIGDTPDGLRYNFLIEEGTIDGPLLRGKFLPEGGDFMRVRTDGIGIPSIRVTFLLDDGAKVYMESAGWFDFGPNGYENAKAGRFAAAGNLISYPYFFTSHPKYSWLLRAQCFGVGVVDLKAFVVRDDVHQILRD
ncbi:MAG: DUF3237 domain-containing protein [Bryobacteraceae bacterium]